MTSQNYFVSNLDLRNQENYFFSKPRAVRNIFTNYNNRFLICLDVHINKPIPSISQNTGNPFNLIRNLAQKMYNNGFSTTLFCTAMVTLVAIFLGRI